MSIDELVKLCDEIEAIDPSMPTERLIDMVKAASRESLDKVAEALWVRSKRPRPLMKP